VSTQALGGLGAAASPGEAAALARVRELQGLIAQTRAVSAGAPTVSGASAPAPAGSTAFAAALQAATAGTPATGGAASAEGSGATRYDAMIEQSALRNGVDPAILHGLIQQESGFDPNSRSSAGASGLTQLMPGTASSLGVSNPLDPAQSIEGGARYLSQMLGQFQGNTSEALAAYNAGPGAVRQYGGIPPYPETQSYVSKVLGYAEGYRREHPSSVSGGVA
jgi:soluble lytic murein transglycosylase-like protein